MGGHLITNVKILDGTGRAPFPGAVRVEAGRIAEVIPGAAPPAAGASVLDGRGATLMPGLVEPHAHLLFADGFSHEMMPRPGSAARSWGGGVELGVVKAGALADLLLVDGDPLANIEILQDRSALRMVMKDGVVHRTP